MGVTCGDRLVLKSPKEAIDPKRMRNKLQFINDLNENKQESNSAMIFTRAVIHPSMRTTLYTLTTNNIATVTDDDNEPVFYVGAQCKSFQRIFLSWRGFEQSSEPHYFCNGRRKRRRRTNRFPFE